MGRGAGGSASEGERLTVAETAAELQFSEKTVRRLIRRGELPAYKMSPRGTQVFRVDLDAFIESRRIAPAHVDRR